MRDKTKPEYESDRTQILRLLVEVGFREVPIDQVIAVMDQSFHTISAESLDFSLRYMADRGWVELGEEKVPGKQPRLLYAKITAEGVEEFDRRRREVVRIGKK